MVRTQIQLTEQQARQVKTAAKEAGVSIAELIRQYVDEGLARRRTSRASLYERASRWVGSCQDPEGADDLSANHDRYLEEEQRRLHAAASKCLGAIAGGDPDRSTTRLHRRPR